MSRLSDDNALVKLATELGRHLLAAGLSVSVAESCTGGWIAKTLTDVPGSSGWFGYGLVTYSNQAKRDLLAVSGEALIQHGAVSAEVVEQMAAGVCRVSGAQLGLSVSGIAGPDGGTADKPVGTVWFGLAVCSGLAHQSSTLSTELVHESPMLSPGLAHKAPTLPPGLPHKARAVSSQCCHFDGDRQAVRRASVLHALQMLLQQARQPITAD